MRKDMFKFSEQRLVFENGGPLESFSKLDEGDDADQPTGLSKVWDELGNLLGVSADILGHVASAAAGGVELFNDGIEGVKALLDDFEQPNYANNVLFKKHPLMNLNYDLAEFDLAEDDGTERVLPRTVDRMIYRAIFKQRWKDMKSFYASAKSEYQLIHEEIEKRKSSPEYAELQKLKEEMKEHTKGNSRRARHSIFLGNRPVGASTVATSIIDKKSERIKELEANYSVDKATWPKAFFIKDSNFPIGNQGRGPTQYVSTRDTANLEMSTGVNLEEREKLLKRTLLEYFKLEAQYAKLDENIEEDIRRTLLDETRIYSSEGMSNGSINRKCLAPLNKLSGHLNNQIESYQPPIVFQ